MGVSFRGELAGFGQAWRDGVGRGHTINSAPEAVRVERTRFTAIKATAVGDVSGGALRSIGPLELADTTFENVVASSTEGLCEGGGLLAVTFGGEQGSRGSAHGYRLL